MSILQAWRAYRMARKFLATTEIEPETPGAPADDPEPETNDGPTDPNALPTV